MFSSYKAAGHKVMLATLRKLETRFIIAFSGCVAGLEAQLIRNYFFSFVFAC